MDIEQIRGARREMENTIRTAVAAAMKVFRTKTSLSPERIDVYLVKATTIEDREERYEVGEVRADVPL